MRGLMQRVRAIVALEGDGYERLFPGGRWIVPVAALGTGLAFGLLRPDITFMYSESTLFLTLCLVSGTLGRTTATAFVGGFVLGDGAWYVTSGAFALSARSKIGGQRDMALGRLTAWFLAWLLASAIPLMARRAGTAVLSSQSRLYGVHGTMANLVVAIVGAPVLALAGYCFLQLIPYLIPPAFSIRNPPVAAITPLQDGAIRIVLVSAAVFVLVELFLRPRLGRLADLSGVEPGPAGEQGTHLVARAAAFGVVMVLFRNMLTTPRDFLALAGAFVIAEVGVDALRRAPALAQWVARVPWIVRALTAAGLAGLTFHKVFTATYGRGPAITFFPMILAAAVGFTLFRILLSVQAPVPSHRGAVRVPRAAAPDMPPSVLVFASIVSWNLAAPGLLWGDNCSDMGDCVRGALAGAWAAAVAAAAFLWAVVKAIYSKVPRPISTLEPLASEEGAAAEGGAMDALQSKVASAKDAKEATDENPNPGQAIRNMSRAQFYQAAKNGDFAGLGVPGW